MLVSNMVVDIGVAAMIVFVPVYSALMIMPWDHMGGGRVAAAIRTYGPRVAGRRRGIRPMEWPPPCSPCPRR